MIALTAIVRAHPFILCPFGVDPYSFEFWTQAIAVHTFFNIFWSVGVQSLFVPRLVVVSMWLFIFLLVTAIDATHRNPQEAFVAPTPVGPLPFCMYTMHKFYLAIGLVLCDGLLYRFLNRRRMDLAVVSSCGWDRYIYPARHSGPPSY
jgi:hypothetical protein